MARIAVLHHLAQPFLGYAAALGDGIEQHFLHRGDPLPDLGAVDGIVSLGGEQNVGEAPELEPEVALLREAVERDVPVLGICLGGQLLAHALGARIWRPGRVCEWRMLDHLPGAEDDPVFGGLPDPVPALHFNEDVFELPRGATPLLTSEGPEAMEAFRYRRAWAVQFHPDVDGAAVDAWAEQFPDWMPQGVEAFRRDSARHADAQRAASEHIFGAFARVVAG